MTHPTVSMQVHDVAEADDSVQRYQVVQRNTEQLTVKEPSSWLVKCLVWTQVVVTERQTLSAT